MKFLRGSETRSQDGPNTMADNGKLIAEKEKDAAVALGDPAVKEQVKTGSPYWVS